MAHTHRLVENMARHRTADAVAEITRMLRDAVAAKLRKAEQSVANKSDFATGIVGVVLRLERSSLLPTPDHRDS